MVFSSIFFICFFLPLVIVGYLVIPQKYKNLFLLFASFIFYTWGEPKLLFVMLAVIVVNYYSGILVDNNYRKIGLTISIIVSLGALAIFKYTNFAYTSIIGLLQIFNMNDNWYTIPKIALPIGISFYVFQTLSYNIDIYRKEIKASKSLINFAMYVSFFPQLVAGPIIRYKDIETHLVNRKSNINDIAAGVERFIWGLAKKIVIANNCAYIADSIFNVEPSFVSPFVSWIGIIFYTLQIYFDFSGYSDMAIGLARIFGFNFSENFNYPYIALSIKEFWRRWHISLSSWFKDYLYISLGGNRNGKIRTHLNLFIVFFATGLWHGASWNFIIWGLWHGCFIVLERIGLDKILIRTPKFIQHIYLMLIVMIGWVFFRADNLNEAISYLKNMFGIHNNDTNNIIFQLTHYLEPINSITFILAIIFCFPIFPVFRKRIESFIQRNIVISYIYYAILLFVFVYLIATQTITTYNPFIYFKF